jgi:hypothetical protein
VEVVRLVLSSSRFLSDKSSRLSNCESSDMAAFNLGLLTVPPPCPRLSSSTTLGDTSNWWGITGLDSETKTYFLIAPEYYKFIL